jgi:hypothetical protein
MKLFPTNVDFSQNQLLTMLNVLKSCLTLLFTTCPKARWCDVPNGVFALDVKSVLNKNLGGILGGMQC